MADAGIRGGRARYLLMIDLHTHTFFSDGVLIPSELVYRAKVQGYTAIGLTDHGDFSTFGSTIPKIAAVAEELARHYRITVIPGVEITYVPPALIAGAIRKCRKLGARLVIVHGETTAETVPPGTNLAALRAGADILAHPGRISADEVRLAAANNVRLEITTRAGHNAANAHVARLAREHGARLVLNTDTHAPGDLLTEEKIRATLRSSALPAHYYGVLEKNSTDVVRHIAAGKKRRKA